MKQEIESHPPYGAWALKKQDLDSFDWWMTYDPIHKPEPMTPLAGSILAFLEQHGFCSGAEKASLPISNGMCCRIGPGGYEAISQAIPTTPQQKEERAKRFDQLKNSFLNDFEYLWGDFEDQDKVGILLKEIQDNYAKIGTLDCKTWFFDLDTLNSRLRLLSNGDLLDLFLKVMEVNRRTWEIHFQLMYLCFSVYMDFENLVKDLFGFGDESPMFKKMMQGFDNKIYDCDSDLWRLMNLLFELDLVKIFEQSSPSTVLSILRKTPQGEKWFVEFQSFLRSYGRRTAVPHDIFKPTWLEDPSPVLTIIRDRLNEGPNNYNLNRQRIVRERECTILKLSSGLQPENRQRFNRSLKAAQIAYRWNEDHNYWIEQMWSSSTRYIALEIGNRFFKGGSISEANDIFFLNMEEIKATFFGAIAGIFDFHNRIEERRQAWKRAFNKLPPRIIGKWVREEVRDPILIKVFGLGRLARPSERVDISGFPGSSGVCEGVATVVEDVNDLYQVQTGKILVTGATNPAWTIIFGKIRGVVTDHGGTLSHAAIVAREYGIPAVVGTGDATKRIRNGQKIRIDGDRGLVWLS